MRKTLLMVALLSFAAAGLLASQSGAAGTADRAKGKDVSVLLGNAKHLVRQKAKFDHAVMLEAQGKTGHDHRVKRASDIDHWRFVLDNQKTNGSPFDSVTIKHTPPKGFGKVRGYEQPFFGDRRIKNLPPMTLHKAVRLLKGAGYEFGFFNVTLRRPLGANVTPPLYIFTLGGGKYVGVNTKSGSVKPFS